MDDVRHDADDRAVAGSSSSKSKRTRWPIGEPSGHASFAIDSLITATGMESALSRLSGRRPLRAAIRNVSK